MQYFWQEVSRDKSSILFSDNMKRSVWLKLQHLSCFHDTNKFSKYLGVPLNGKSIERHDYKYLIDQVSSKLARRKAKNLSMEGRITLAKSVIKAIPMYPMMKNIIPQACIKEIPKLDQNFFWRDTDVKKKMHVVWWETVMLRKDNGGLGLHDIKIMNQACIIKLS